MGKQERKDFEAKEGYDAFLKECKDFEKKITAALSISYKYSGKLQTMKELNLAVCVYLSVFEC